MTAYTVEDGDRLLVEIHAAFTHCYQIDQDCRNGQTPADWDFLDDLVRIREEGDAIFEHAPYAQQKEWCDKVRQLEVKFRALKKHVPQTRSLQDLPILMWTPDPTSSVLDVTAGTSGMMPTVPAAGNAGSVPGQSAPPSLGAAAQSPAPVPQSQSVPGPGQSPPLVGVSQQWSNPNSLNTVHNSPVFKTLSFALPAAAQVAQICQVDKSYGNLIQATSKKTMLLDAKAQLQALSQAQTDDAAVFAIADMTYNVDTLIATLESVLDSVAPPTSTSSHALSTLAQSSGPSPPSLVGHTAGTVAQTMPTVQSPLSQVAGYPLPSMQPGAMQIPSAVFYPQNDVQNQLMVLKRDTALEKNLKTASENLLPFEGGVLEYVKWKASLSKYLSLETDQFRKYHTIKKL